MTTFDYEIDGVTDRNASGILMFLGETGIMGHFGQAYRNPGDLSKIIVKLMSPFSEYIKEQFKENGFKVSETC